MLPFQISSSCFGAKTFGWKPGWVGFGRSDAFKLTPTNGDFSFGSFPISAYLILSLNTELLFISNPAEAPKITFGGDSLLS